MPLVMPAFASFVLAFSLLGSSDPVFVASRQGTVSVVVKRHGSIATTASRDLTLVFTPAMSATDAAALNANAAIRKSVVDDEPVEVVLPEGHWAVDAESPVLWHAAQAVAVTPDTTAQIVVDVWPKASITGKVETRSTVMPDELRIRFESVDSSVGSSFGGEIPCRIVDAAFHCSFPAGAFHLRLRPRGFIAQYRQNVKLVPGSSVDLGILQFREGQSITGRIQLPEEFKGAGSDVVVTVTPATGGNVQALPGGRLLPISATAENNGFFHVDGIAPGSYAVQARYGRTLVSDTVLVDVRAAREAELVQQLRLDAPRTITLAVTPAKTPAGERWHVRLSEEVAEHLLDPRTESNATAEGRWVSPPLQPGRYWLTVGTVAGDVWHTEEIRLDETNRDVHVAISSRSLLGTVKFGDKPLQASLTFTSSAGLQTTTESNAEGAYAVTLPSTVAGTALKVRVDSESPYIQRIVSLPVPNGDRAGDIVLPRSVLHGSVVDGDGVPVNDAVVYIGKGDADEPLIDADTAPDGTFAIYALSEGAYTVMASAFMRESAPQTVEIEDGHTPDAVTLVIRPMSAVRGRVLSPSGPVPGATVQARAADVDQQIVIRRQTDVNGEFTVPAAPGSRAVDLSVSAPGFSYVVMGAALTGRPLNVAVDQRGGTITVRAKGADIPYLVHNGATVPVTAVAFTWPVASQNGPDGDREFVLPMMEPGLYAACLLDPAAADLFRRSGGQNGGRCVSGALAPFGSLALNLPRD